ncbi:MAG: hypothetical protein M1281_07015 [Chloroflexi bacterium]|nr:hypothetical protein [Chloroflexota bacterium]
MDLRTANSKMTGDTPEDEIAAMLKSAVIISPPAMSPGQIRDVVDKARIRLKPVASFPLWAIAGVFGCFLILAVLAIFLSGESSIERILAAWVPLINVGLSPFVGIIIILQRRKRHVPY